MPDVCVPIAAVLIGTVAPFRAADEPSAIAKRAIDRPVAVTPLGLAGDEQADRVHHGGSDKAIHHYPFDHYAHWQGRFGAHPLLAAPGAFGENIATHGLTDDAVCLGDRFRLGTALVEVSHGRQPCWKLGHRFGRPELTALVVETGRAGWYYRVLEPGTVGPGDRLELVERSLPQWSVARLFDIVVGSGHKRAPEALRELAALPVLADAWRLRARDLAG
ncbi:MAG: MOSC domain-containing protein [Sphingomonadales bacterium]|nr:MOSC domain-containing protein [Sphingomonadales bacterium]